MKIKNLSIILVLMLIISTVPFAASAAIDPYSMISAPNFNSTNNASANKPNGAKLPISRNSSDWVCYENVNFTDAPYAVVVSNAVGSDYLKNNEIVFRLDSPTGPVISTVYITECKEWSTPVDNVGSITETITGTHNIYMSSNQPNDVYSFYFKAHIKGEMRYIAYDETSAFGDMEGNPYKEEAEILYGLGIVNEHEKGIFLPDLPITRGVFASWVAHFMTAEVPEPESSVFTDVTADYKYYKEVCYLYDNGLLKLNDTKTFNPWSFITVREASAIMLRLMGYEKMADYKGGWPSGYDNVARSIGIIKGMAPTDYLRRAPAAGMLYNAIDAEYLSPESVTNGNVTYEKKTGILEDLRNLYKAEGVVTATSYSGMIGDVPVPDGCCYIGTERFEVGNVTVEHYLGVECEYYYTTEDNGKTKTLLYLLPTAKTEQLVLSSKEVDFIEIGSEIISYKDENGKKKELDISSKAVWVYNNKALEVDISEVTEAKTFSGSIRLVDNGDGWNTVFVEEYINIKVQSFNNDKQELSDALSGDSWSFLNKTLIMSDGLETVSSRDIERGMLAELYLSHDGNMAVILFGEEKMTGSVSQITKEGAVVIGSHEYYLANECKDEIVLGITTDFYLNRHGEIVYTEINDTTKAVGVLEDVTEDGDTTIISLITATNTVTDFLAASKIIVDGVRMEEYEDISKQLSITERYKPVLYRTNEVNEITMIDTLVDSAMNEHDTFNVIDDYDPARTYYYRSGLKAFTPEQVFEITNPVTSSTKVILMNKNNLSGADCYFGTMSSFYSNDDHPFAFYSFTRDNKIADVVYHPSYSNHSWQTCHVFKGTHVAVNAKGDIGINVELVNSGGEKTYWVSETNTVIIDTINSLEPGDAIRFSTDMDGGISEISVRAFANQASSNEAGLSAAVHKSNGSSGGVNISENFVYGTIVDIIDNYIIVEAFGNGRSFWLDTTSKSLITVNEDEIKGGVSPNNAKVGDTLFAYLSGNVQTMVVYE